MLSVSVLLRCTSHNRHAQMYKLVLAPNLKEAFTVTKLNFKTEVFGTMSTFEVLTANLGHQGTF